MDNLGDTEKKHETEQASIIRTPASFEGKLNLANYAFSARAEQDINLPSPQRITRSGLINPPFLSASPVKRKASSLGPPSSPRKKSKSPSTGYAPPSKYAHLAELRDIIEPDLICLFIGLNPGLTTSTTGHAYAHPSNHFWKLLYSSGCTTRLCKPEEDGKLPAWYDLGNTNIVARPTRNGSELSKSEMDEGVQILEEKIRSFRPQSVCIVGKSIWESIWRVKHGKKIGKEEFKYGWQDESENMGKEGSGGSWDGAKVFVATTTSGLAATMSMAEKQEVWNELGTWVKTQRDQRRADKSITKSCEEGNL